MFLKTSVSPIANRIRATTNATRKKPIQMMFNTIRRFGCYSCRLSGINAVSSDSLCKKVQIPLCTSSFGQFDGLPEVNKIYFHAFNSTSS